jgi:hypothetical protein
MYHSVNRNIMDDEGALASVSGSVSAGGGRGRKEKG